MISWEGRHLKIGECPFILWSYLEENSLEACVVPLKRCRMRV